MSKINAVRLINFNYNNNSIRISDETFHMNGKSTLMSLRNGGGKTVLVQLMTAPFVHKRYRNTGDRIFSDYFTTNKPTFILVEWQLDNQAGYVMTGLMVRKNQDITEENNQSEDPLETIGIISAYRQPCLQDIYHLPVVDKTEKEMKLKGWGACKQLFESYKKDRTNQFTYYDLNSVSQAKQYFDNLQDYQIYYKEWESIIKKVNLKESGLSELFSDCKDEKGLVEKWFLDIVESKLNKDKNRMKEFQNIIEKYAAQYMENKSKLERREIIKKFHDESDEILSKTKAYDDMQQLVSTSENRIACFIKELERLTKQAGKSRTELKQEIDEIRKQIAYISYEKISKEIHELNDLEHNQSVNLQIIDLERESFLVESNRLEKELHLLECAGARDTALEDEKSYLESKERLEAAKQEAEDIEPVIKSLGYQLRVYYKEQAEQTDEQLSKNEEEIRQYEENIINEKQMLSQLQQSYVKEKEKIAADQAKLQIFDDKETQFNRRYQENLGRNILGEYEPGLLEAKRRAYDLERDNGTRENLSNKKQLEEAQNQHFANQRKQEETKQSITENRFAIEKAEEKNSQYIDELEDRKKILRYLDLPEDNIFLKDKIIDTSMKKIQEITRVRREFEKEEDELRKEYAHLLQGKILELPEDFQKMLDNLSIQYVYGMDWLKKNNNSLERNKELVRNYPFLPYSLILSQNELGRLQEQINKDGDKTVYTSFPIPITVREKLAEEGMQKADMLVELSNIHFYVWFNENLLDEDMLRQMIEDKKKQIDKLGEKIEQKKNEYEETIKRQEKILNQEVTKELYDKNIRDIEQANEKKVSLEELLRELKEQASVIETRIKHLQDSIQTWEKYLEKLMQKISDYAVFLKDYEEYRGYKDELEAFEKEVERIENLQTVHSNQLVKEENELKTCENVQQKLEERQKQYTLKRTEFEDFEETEILEQTESIESAEAKYRALTQQYSAERQVLEKISQDARKRLESSKNKFKKICEKYDVIENELEGIVYDEKEEQSKSKALKRAEENYNKKDAEYHKTDTAIALTRQKAGIFMEKMKNECHEDEPLAKDSIKTENFEERITQCEALLTEKEEQDKIISGEIAGYESNLTSLSEYSNFEIVESVKWEEHFEKMSRKELDQFRGKMLRDYRNGREKTNSAYEDVINVLNEVIRKEEFKEDFYKKPLESMIQVARDAKRLEKQIVTTLQSYDSLMEKLNVDIAIIEKERKQIIELLFEYVKDVHENIGKIDRNSTITVREKPVKMLKIILPQWEENESIYKIRLQDFVDLVTDKGVALFEQNQNAQEFFGTQITTKKLYDTVVGTGNIQIKLSKIEAQREYPITWAEVAKNSGGEGFLSAFVILSSLLYYMRRDDTDIFADKNEGKVLVMDNPFAQTNASHLLKPLMEVAKKTNTQLICLSGLGESSIYNRFDNIYVLTLKESNLRNGMQYLKGEHAQGEEAQDMILSQIEVMQQQSLLF